MSVESSQTLHRVYYPGFNMSGGVQVQRLRYPESVESLAPQFRGLILGAYSNEFEQPRGPLPRGTVAQRYGEEQNATFAERAAEHHERGSQFWVIRQTPQRLLGFAKVTPGEALDDPRPGYVYINDVVVRPGLDRRRGYATVMLHAALRFGGHNPNHGVVLDAFEASEDRLESGYIVPGPNQLYRGMGLQRSGIGFDGDEVTGTVESFPFPNGTELLMCEYRTPAGMTVDGVVRALVHRRPNLEGAYGQIA